MSQRNIIYVKAANCTKSPLNVRKHNDPEADAQLEANIEAEGVIQNLIGLPVPRKKGHYKVTGGGRRLDRVHNLQVRGIFDQDYLVPIMVMTNAKNAIETSFAENFFKLDMNPADACRAFQDIIETERKSPADVAKRFGLTVHFVQGRLRLASLAEPVFDALRNGVITLEIAKAYASTSDTARQTSVYEDLAGYHYHDNVHEIRRRLASGSYKGADPKAMFVGRDAYQEAGGRIDSDLFSDDATETWIDGDLLDRLADEKLAEAAAAVRERDGFAEVRTITASQVPYGETYQLNRLVGEPLPLSAEAEARKNEIEAELAAIEAAADETDDYTEEQSERIEELEEELGSVVETPCIISDEQRTSAIAYLVIGRDGEARMHEQLYTMPLAEEEVVEPDEDGDEDLDTVEDESDDETGSAKLKYSQRLSDELAMMKTELIAVHVANDPHFALDLGTFFMIDAATRAIGAYDLPTELRANKPSPRVGGFKSGMAAAEAWAKLDEELNRSWMNHKEMHERYDAFCTLDEDARAAWLGWAIARTLQAVSAGSKGDTFLSHIGRKLQIDVAAWWRPTARNFFDRISKKLILGLLEQIGGSELKSRYAGSRKFDLAASSEKLFGGQTLVEADVKQRALVWLPDPMRFDLGLAEDLVDQTTDTALNDTAGDHQPGADDELARVDEAA